jgi:hypothetical protein
MPYLNLDLDFFDHPKTKRLVGLLGRGAEVLPLRLWCYCGKYHSADGRLAGYSGQEIESLVGWWGKEGQMISAMQTVRMLEKAGEEGWQVMNWEEHQGHIDALRQRGKAMAEARWAKLRASNAVSIAQVMPGQCSDQPVPTNQPCRPKSKSGGGGGKGVRGKGDTPGAVSRFPLPAWDELPRPLYADTAKAMLAAIEEQEKEIRVMSHKIPIKRKTDDGSEYVVSHRLEPEAIEAIRQWEERRKQIHKALAG